MQNSLNIPFNTKLTIKTSEEITEQLMVCSHERSGTHFLMNSMDLATTYCSNPFLNYDLYPLGGKLNFHSEGNVRNFINSLSTIKINGKINCNSSILKSHFPMSLLGEEASSLPLKIIYIWRDPVETLTSLWKFMHRWGWNEGPKTKTALELASAKPSGQSQRYQTSNYKDYFERWASHVIDGLEYCRINPKARSVSYKDLLLEHSATTEKICSALNIQILRTPISPNKIENVIKGASLYQTEGDVDRLKNFCDKRLEDFPELRKLFRS